MKPNHILNIVSAMQGRTYPFTELEYAKFKLIMVITFLICSHISFFHSHICDLVENHWSR